MSLLPNYLQALDFLTRNLSSQIVFDLAERKTSFLRLACIVIVAILLSVGSVRAQSPVSFMNDAIELARTSQRATGVPASVTLAQSVLETGRGLSPVGSANNYFGIKASRQLDGTINFGSIATGWVWADTREWDGKKYINVRDRFREYRSMEDSFRDHAVLLSTNPRYAGAMQVVDDPRTFAQAIAAAGYATSPTYGADLVQIMDNENLYQYDLPRDAAEFLGQSNYLTVAPGEIFQIYFDVKNTGFATWRRPDDYYLASVNDQRFAANPRQELNAQVPSESSKRWAITMVAPFQPGTYRTAWSLKHGPKSFGPELFIQVTVHPAEDTFSSLRIPIFAGIFLSILLVLAWLTRSRWHRGHTHSG